MTLYTRTITSASSPSSRTSSEALRAYSAARSNLRSVLRDLVADRDAYLLLLAAIDRVEDAAVEHALATRSEMERAR